MFNEISMGKIEMDSLSGNSIILGQSYGSNSPSLGRKDLGRSER